MKKEALEEAFLCAKYAKEMLLPESLFFILVIYVLCLARRLMFLLLIFSGEYPVANVFVLPSILKYGQYNGEAVR